MKNLYSKRKYERIHKFLWLNIMIDFRVSQRDYYFRVLTRGAEWTPEPSLKEVNIDILNSILTTCNKGLGEVLRKIPSWWNPKLSQKSTKACEKRSLWITKEPRWEWWIIRIRLNKSWSSTQAYYISSKKTRVVLRDGTLISLPSAARSRNPDLCGLCLMIWNYWGNFPLRKAHSANLLTKLKLDILIEIILSTITITLLQVSFSNT